MGPIVVTAGETFVDIDAVACAIAYAELLRLHGREALAVFPGPLNHSVTPCVKSLGLSYETVCPESADSFVIVDTSNPDHLALCVDIDRVSEIYDHHDGFQIFWQERLGERSRIDMIGAAATLIWEAFERANAGVRISQTSARLLCYAIVSNTLNFKFSLTCERDHRAFHALLPHARFQDGWIEQYFLEVEQAVVSDLVSSIRNDTKVANTPGLGENVAVGQLELWDPSELLRSRRKEMETVLAEISERWLINLPSLKDGTTIFLSPDPDIQLAITEALSITFENDVAIAQGLFLRKTYLPLLRTRRTETK